MLKTVLGGALLNCKSSSPEVLVLMRRLSKRVNELGSEVEQLRADIRMLHANIEELHKNIEKLSRLVSELTVNRLPMTL